MRKVRILRILNRKGTIISHNYQCKFYENAKKDQAAWLDSFLRVKGGPGKIICFSVP